mmetsp:Transcript_109837/g.317564  ORF Transcript_109837/g.317564 Transcript_109837/m.317564 type:complete len:396 (-) Transcript_109837:247-1434(-)
MARAGSSALVNVADDAELRLVRHLAESAACTSSGFIQECEASISGGDASKLMSIILGESKVMEALTRDDEATSAVSLLAALLDRAKDSQLVGKLADSLIQVSTDTNKTISLLAALYNMRSGATEKTVLMAKMIALAAERQPASLEPQSSMLGKWMDASRLSAMLDEWDVEPVDRRPLYMAAAESASSPVTKQRFNLMVVETYSRSDIDAQGLAVSKQAAVGAILDPVSLFEEQRNIMSLPAIQALKEKSGPLFSLLHIFQGGKLQDYYAFIEANGGDDILKQWEGLTPETCVRYMRILSLCSLASEHEEIPYKVVADTLQTGPEEVEEWVIAAVSSGLLSAKMDQLQNMVVVESCVVRKFGMEQWKAVQSRLHSWKHNVGGILEAYRLSIGQQQQ